MRSSQRSFPAFQRGAMTTRHGVLDAKRNNMTQTTLTTFDQTGFDAFIESRDEPDWLLSMRREAWQHASEMQWPERRHEEWIRTDIRAFQIGKYDFSMVS